LAHFEIRIDTSRPLSAEPESGHNRWHPDIPPILHCGPGDSVTMGTRDALDGQITPASTVADVAGLNSNLVHPLTGPVFIEHAEPGDLLVADILEVVPPSFGYTCQIPGLGFLRNVFREPYLVKWRIDGEFATSQEIPGVRLRGGAFMGTIGVAPSREQVRSFAARELALKEIGGDVLLPEIADAMPPDPAIATSALRTIPPRENAGNVDIRHLVAGTRVLIPVWTQGALFSAGDAHFAQGAGEVCGQAVEMAATLRVHFDLLKGEAAAHGINGIRFEGGINGSRARGPYYATTGINVRSSGVNESEDLTLAARNALEAMMEYIVSTYGYSPQQAYAICSVSVDLEVGQVVNEPNFLVTAFLPLDIFE
jgi:formamidase